MREMSTQKTDGLDRSFCAAGLLEPEQLSSGEISAVIQRRVQLAAIDGYPHVERLTRSPVSVLLNGASLAATLERV
jgi:hypothetical protein